MKRRNDNRRAALAWYPTPTAGAWPHSLRWARRPPPDIDPEAEAIRELVEDSGVDGYSGGKPVEFEHRGLTIRVKVEYDGDIDPKDHTGITYEHGKHDANGNFRLLKRRGVPYGVEAVAVRARHGNRPERNAYEHVDLSDYVWERYQEARSDGMTRHAAWEFAKACGLTEYESLEQWLSDDWWYVWIKVTVEDDCGCELGEASVGGVSFDPSDKGATAYVRSTVEDLVHEALRDAKRDKLTLDLFDTFQHGAGI